jgi:pyruvate formate lyase activating enzyme
VNSARLPAVSTLEDGAVHDGPTGLVTNIQRFSIHDGPGIRTTVFLKGCNLRCFWCHNPEDMNPQPEIQFFPERCIFCGACVENCPQAAHRIGAEGDHAFLRDLCDACGLCIDTCYAGGLVLVGTRMTVAQVLADVLADQAFYASSGGGLTVSGGEPLLQFDFTYALLAEARRHGIHTAVETAANFPWERVAAILPVVDLVMMDIKHLDSAKHRAATGVPNERILANARRLGAQPQPLIVRTPVIPGVNDTVEEIAAIADFVAQLPGLAYYELLPYHPMATSKYRSLDLDYRAVDLVPPTKAKMAELAAAAARHGIDVRTG